MKIIKNICPQCGGKIKKLNSELLRCESCQTEFYIEKKGPKIHQTINNYYYDKKKQTDTFNSIKKSLTSNKKNISNKLSLVKLTLPLIIIALFIAADSFLDRNIRVENSMENSKTFKKIETREQVESPAMSQFLHQIYGKPVDELTETELKKITYLEISENDDFLEIDSHYVNKDSWIFSYSFDSYNTSKDMKIKDIYIDKENTLDEADVSVLSGLEYLKIDDITNINHSGKISLNKMTNLLYYKASFNYITDDILLSIPNKEKIKGISIDLDNNHDIEILNQFPNIKLLRIHDIRNNTELFDGERLDLDLLHKFKKVEHVEIYSSVEDISWLSGFSKLKSLSLSHASDIRNYTVLYSLPNLEELSITHGSFLKDLDFINSMPKLSSLTIQNSEINTIKVLNNKKSLVQLKLINNNSLIDCDALNTLSSLKDLELNREWTGISEKIPGLDNLANLNTVKISLAYLDSIQNNPSIRDLTIIGHTSSDSLEGELFSKHFHNLEKLSLIGDSSISLEDNKHLLSLSSLKELSLKNIYFIGNKELVIFNLPSVEKLTIYGRYTSNFDSIQPSTILKDLRITTLSEIENIDILLSKISNFTELKNLEIIDQNIVDLTFIKNLSKIESLDLSDNYITDISILSNLPNLKIVNLENNPIINGDLLEDSTIIME